MNVFLWLVVGALAALLFAFSVYAFEVGGVGLISGARYERCPRCGHHGLARGKALHEHDCPHPAYRERLRQLQERLPGGLHPRHH